MKSVIFGIPKSTGLTIWKELFKAAKKHKLL